MTVTAKTLNFERLKGKMLALVSAGAKARMRTANQKNADEFQALVAQAAPQDPEPERHSHSGHLVDTLAQAAKGELGVQVSIGSEEHPAAAKLEFGHRARDGSHVPGQPFWYPAKRVLRKRSLGRVVRAQRAAIKEIVAGGGGAGG